jgi:gliding motility associated protien GldN
LYAQSNILNASNASEIGIKNFDQKQSDAESSFLDYDYIDDRDILWSKIVYEKIDLNEKLNFPLLFPIDDKVFRNRKSLWKVLNENIKNRKITELYRANNDQFLPEKKLNQASVDSIVSSKIVIGGQSIINEIKSVDIKSYFIKGIWYFDKRQGEMKYRLLGIMPSGNVKNKKGETQETDLFWIWYPSIRKILHEELVFNDRNNANRISFDQLLISRRFNSYIYKEDNVYGNRAIRSYKDKGLQSILESERIKKEILDFEQDMWNR